MRSAFMNKARQKQDRPGHWPGRFVLDHAHADAIRPGFSLAQFANCVLALCVIDEIVINSMTSGKIMEIRPPVS